MMLGSKRLFEKNFQCGTKNLKFLKKKGIKRKVIKNIVHVNAYTGKRERYEEIEKC